MAEEKKLENILVQSLDQVMSDRFGRYSKYIIQGRALPDVRDGLKPVQRRILYSMSELGLVHSSPYKKSARVVGDVIGKYHPHGDSSIYEAMVRMAQDWKMNIPLVDMHGNKGSIDDDPAAAMRYTEVRLAAITQYVLENIKKKTVAFAPNFDDSEKEPTVLPGLFPNLLVNGAKGIAAGYATEMPPHNLGEIADAIIIKIKSPNARLETLMSAVQGPDFPTGGIVQGLEGIYKAFERGQGRILIRSRFTIGGSKELPFINITEIPYGVIKQDLVRTIDEIRFNKKIDGIKDVRDESDRNGISIMIELDANTDAAPIANYLLQKTEMQVYYNYNNVVIHNNAPKQMGLSDLIDAYLEHQRRVQRRAITFDLGRDKMRLEIIEGLIRVSTMADAVINVIRAAEGSKSGVVKALVATFAFTELQASAIADLRLYRLSRTDQDMYQEEAAELRKRISFFQNLLNDAGMFDNYLIDLIRVMKKACALPRRTAIEAEMAKIEINMEELIRHEEIWIGISRLGYLKRVSPRALEANTITDYALKPEDMLVYMHKANTADKLLAFTDRGRFVFLPLHLVAETKWKDFGKHINDFALLEPDERIIDAFAVSDFKLHLFLTLVTSDGKIKRTALADFELARYSKPSTAFVLKDESVRLVAVRPSNGMMQITLIASDGHAIRYPETQVPAQGTKSGGVVGMALVDDATVTSMVVANVDDVIGFISNRGGAKRLRINSVPSASRTAQGRHIFREVRGNPHLAIDGNVVLPETSVLFIDHNSNKITTVEFRTIDITSSDEGFSLVGPGKNPLGRIVAFQRLEATLPMVINAINRGNDDEVMQAATEKINEASQISLDDILKNIDDL